MPWQPLSAKTHPSSSGMAAWALSLFSKIPPGQSVLRFSMCCRHFLHLSLLVYYLWLLVFVGYLPINSSAIILFITSWNLSMVALLMLANRPLPFWLSSSRGTEPGDIHWTFICWFPREHLQRIPINPKSRNLWSAPLCIEHGGVVVDDGDGGDGDGDGDDGCGGGDDAGDDGGVDDDDDDDGDGDHPFSKALFIVIAVIVIILVTITTITVVIIVTQDVDQDNLSIQGWANNGASSVGCLWTNRAWFHGQKSMQWSWCMSEIWLYYSHLKINRFGMCDIYSEKGQLILFSAIT